MAAVRAYVRRSQSTTKRATLRLSKFRHDEILKHIISRCKGLQRLDIVSGSAGVTILSVARLAIELKTLILSDCDVTLDTVCQLLLYCSNLERAEFHKVRCLIRTTGWQDNMSKIRSLLINAPPNQAPDFGLVSESLLNHTLHIN